MLPRRALYDTELREYAKTLRIPYFRGVFMRNAMPKKPHTNECAIINLDSSSGGGTHWTAYRKRGENVIYYDSFGNLRPPKELIEYLGRGVKIQYNHDREQNYNTSICGHLCLNFLSNK